MSDKAKKTSAGDAPEPETSAASDPSPPPADSQFSKTRKLYIKSAYSNAHVYRLALHWSQLLHDVHLEQLRFHASAWAHPMFAQDVDPADLASMKQVCDKCAQLRAVPTFAELARSWPRRDGTDVHLWELDEHIAAFHRFKTLARVGETRGPEVVFLEWLDSLDGPLAKLDDIWKEPTGNEEREDEVAANVMKRLLGPVFRLLDGEHLGSVGAFRDALQTCHTAQIGGAIPGFTAAATWAQNMLGMIATAATFEELAIVYKVAPYDYATRSIIVGTLRNRARCIRKMLKFVQLAFRARLEEIVGNIALNAKQPSHAHIHRTLQQQRAMMMHRGQSVDMSDVAGQCVQQ